MARAARAGRHLRLLLDRLDEETRDLAATEEWPRLLERYAGGMDAEIRAAVLAELLRYVGSAPEITASGLALLRQADLIFRGDDAPASALARQATIIRAGADTRAERVRARAHLRLGVALGRLGDPRGAIRAYEALDALAAGSSERHRDRPSASGLQPGGDDRRPR